MSAIVKISRISSIPSGQPGAYSNCQNMLGQIKRLLSPPNYVANTKITEISQRPGVLAVTADVRFYAGVLNATSKAKWRTEWARTLGRAIEICRLEPTPIVIYDSNLPDIEWGSAFDLMNAVPNHRRILLAAPSIDEDLWRKVLLHRGYDIVKRSAGSEELKRVFRFAWLSLVTPA
jgi:hypothetical protein